MKAVILAAGMGMRMGSPLPKPLTPLTDHQTILDFQIEKLSCTVGPDRIFIVVGYKYPLIMDRYPDMIYVYNADYVRTSTAKSLLHALKKIEDEDVLWMNGDIFFADGLLERVLRSPLSACLVDQKNCGEEEVKYNLDRKGFIRELSKKVPDARGEALGINLIRRKDLGLFKKELEAVEAKAFFEKALENLTLAGKLRLHPVDCEGLFCHEIDFEEDLKCVKSFLQKRARPRRKA